MASKGMQTFSRSLRALRVPSRVVAAKDPLTQCLAPRLSRSLATEATTLTSSSSASQASDITTGLEHLTLSAAEAEEPAVWPLPDVTTTVHRFPSMEPLHFATYAANQLYLPLRRDLLHRAVIYEGDNTRAGLASTKNRWEVHGSHRKIRPQKGTGSARLGTRQSGMLRGGGKSFGPHPRDFGTGLPRKIYDQAWRIALSYRYRRGELLVCEDGMDLAFPYVEYLQEVLAKTEMDRKDNRALFITQKVRKNLFTAMEKSDGLQGRAQLEEDTDVKDLLELGKIVIEKSALDSILANHSSDLYRQPAKAVYE